MKKVAFAILLFFAVNVQAQEKSALQTKSEELIHLTGAGKAFEDAIAQIGAGVGADNKEAYRKEAEGTLAIIKRKQNLYCNYKAKDHYASLALYFL